MTGRAEAAALLARFAPGIGLAATALFFWIIAPGKPLQTSDVQTILVQAVIVGTVALGMSLVIVSGGIDLSVGSSVALCGVVAAKTMQGDWPGWAGQWAQPGAAALAAVAAGGLCGLYNGLLISLLRLPPFIVTLGTLGFFRGVAKWAAGNSPIYARAGWLENWVPLTPRPAWLLAAPVVWMMALLAAVAAAFLTRTVPGRQIVAIGSNEEAARRAGVPIARVKVLVYTLAGMCVGLAGVVQFARLGGAGDPTVQVGLELKAIASVVIGGATLSGGHVSIAGALCGALLMALLDNRCVALGWPTYVQELVVGHIIILAVALDRWRSRRGGIAA